jgi:cell division protein FtsA
VVIVDIGGGTTDVVAYAGGQLILTTVLPVGGFQFTNDIALIYDTAYSTAESVKLNYAHTDPGGTSAHEEITLQVLGPARERKVHLHDICQLTRERAMELAEIIKMKLKDAGVRNTFDSRIVLTGGASLMPGLLDLMRRVVTSNIRIGTPNDNVVMPDGLRAPSFSTSAGILLWAADQVESGPLKAAHSNAAHRSVAHSNGAHSNGAHSNGATHTNHNGNGKANSTGGKSGAGSIFARPFRALRN